MEWITFATAAVNITVAFMFLGAWFFTRQRALTSFAIGYALFAVTFGLFAFKYYEPAFAHLGNVTMLAGTIVAARGLAQRAPWNINWLAVAALATFGTVGTFVSYSADHVGMRHVSIYISLGTIYFLVAHAGYKASSRFKVERILVFVLFAIGFILITSTRLIASIAPDLMSMEFANSTWPFYAMIWIILSQLLAGLTIALSVYDVIARAKRDAETDVLTGLANRRAFDTAIARRGRENDRPALVMIDIDHFKRINDHFGHDEGDRSIALTGRLVGNATPLGCCAARLGGEEFAVIVNDGGLDAAAAVARDIRNAIRHARRPLDFTVSIGIADGPRDELYKRADEALYRAKREGRNRTCVWEPSGPRQSYGFNMGTATA